MKETSNLRFILILSSHFRLDFTSSL